MIRKDKTKDLCLTGVFISDIDTANFYVQFFFLTKITISAVCIFIKVLMYM